MKNRIIKTDLIDWRKLKPLQPENAKHIFNYKDIEASILKYGFAQPFYVWENDGQLYTIDGHTRIEVLSNIEKTPNKLPATFIDAKDRKEAIEILIEIYNQKSNPFDIEVLNEMIEIDDLNVNVDSVNVKIEKSEEDIEHEENVKDITNMIAVSLTDEENEIWLDTKEKIGKNKDKNVIFELIKLFNIKIVNMRTILIKEICKEKPNSSALGGFNSAYSAFGTIVELRTEKGFLERRIEINTNTKRSEVPTDKDYKTVKSLIKDDKIALKAIDKKLNTKKHKLYKSIFNK